MKNIKLENCINATALVSAFRYTFNKSFSYSGERHGGWEFVYVESGKILATAENEKYIVNSGELICHKPMEFHNLNSYEGDATVVIFCFECEGERIRFFENKILTVNHRARHYISDIAFHASSFLVPEEPIQISIAGKMTKKESADLIHSHFIKNTIELLVLSLYSSESVAVKTRVDAYSSKIRRQMLSDDIKELIWNNLGQKFSLSEIADRVSYSVSTIKNVFKQETGFTLLEYYNQLRIEEAKNMLHGKGLSVAEIAETLGYYSSAHFSNSFKKAVGVSPKKYRDG